MTRLHLCVRGRTAQGQSGLYPRLFHHLVGQQVHTVFLAFWSQSSLATAVWTSPEAGAAGGW
ncbi:hypothetical protein LCGC14_1476430 [marine sediment metagenome]|uniref:Uncharacterized protein n=1 Tax=marine sediment metagenome TaxID=412755 RepID=A0A0F9JWT6_9ZZZZ